MMGIVITLLLITSPTQLKGNTDMMDLIKGKKLYGGIHNSEDGLDIEDFTEEEANLAKNENFVPRVYKDTEGHDTIGIGHRLTDEEKKTGVINGKPIKDYTHEDYKKLYRKDIEEHKRSTNKMLSDNGIDINKLPKPALEVLHDMGYNMGAKGLSTFTKMLGAIREGDYKTAAKEALKSEWSKQVKGRADRLSKKLESAMSESKEKPTKVAPKDINLDNFLDNMSRMPKDKRPDFVKDSGVKAEAVESIPKQEEKEEEKGFFDKLADFFGMSSDEKEESKEEDKKEEEILPKVKLDKLEKKDEEELKEEPTEEPKEESVKEPTLDDSFNKEKAESVGKQTAEFSAPSKEAQKVVGDALPEGLPAIDMLVNSNLVADESWKTKDLDAIAEEMNTNIRNIRREIDRQYRIDKDENKKDQWIMGIVLAAQVFVNGLEAQALQVDDQIINGRLVRGRRAPSPKAVDMSILKSMKDEIEDKRDYRMKRAALTLADAKFRFKVRKDARDLGLRQEKDDTRATEKARLEGKKDKEKLEREEKKDTLRENKEVKRSYSKALDDIKDAKPAKLQEVVRTSLLANTDMTEEEVDDITKERNWLGNLLGNDLMGLGLSDKDKETLIKDVRAKMQGEIKEEKSSKEKVSDTLYNPKIHKLGVNEAGDIWILTKDGKEVAEYGKQ